ncbi:hypothetical protein ACFVWG_20630 [Kribbella sp. NPDC058245]|uniref:hypothetical protein n=1 Tax=Kribbella sp. NPDC058245 TaxID=3346399 RepID=UPI0036E9E26E
MRVKAKRSAAPEGTVLAAAATDAPRTEEGLTQPASRLQALWSAITKEARTHPLASAGALAAVVVIAPLVVGLIQHLNDDPLVLQRSPIDFRIGQNTSPDAVVPGTVNDGDQPPGDNEDFKKWARSHGAVYANTVAISFVARSDIDEPTLVVGASVRVVERRKPLAGTHVVPNGAGPGPDRVLFSDLDQNPATVRLAAGWSFPLTVSRTDIEAFTVVPTTENCYCLFVIELRYVDPDGSTRTISMDDHGKPFELTSATAATKKITVKNE